MSEVKSTTLQEKLEALEAQKKQIEAAHMKTLGAMEIIEALIMEEKELKKESKASKKGK